MLKSLSSNRTLLELKFVAAAPIRPAMLGSNRTLLELKYIYTYLVAYVLTAFQSYLTGIEIK